MSTCTAIDACTKLGLGNIESICGFNVVGHAGKSEYSVHIASHFHCCHCFCLLFSFLRVSSPWPLTLFASPYRPAVGLGMTCDFAVLTCHTGLGFLLALVATLLPSPLFLAESCKCRLHVFCALIIDYMMLGFLCDEGDEVVRLHCPWWWCAKQGAHMLHSCYCLEGWSIWLQEQQHDDCIVAQVRNCPAHL